MKNLNPLFKSAAVFILCFLSFCSLSAQNELNHIFTDAPVANRNRATNANVVAEYKNLQAAAPNWTYLNLGMPNSTKAFGKPINITVKDNPANAAASFIEQYLDSQMVVGENLKLKEERQSSKFHYVDYQQYYHGYPILFSGIKVRLTKDYKVPMVDITFHNNISIDPNPSIAPNQVADLAIKNISGETILSTECDGKPVVVPQYDLSNNAVSFHLAYAAYVHTNEIAGLPKRYYTLVDAHTGEVLYRKNTVYEYDGKVESRVYPTNILEADSVMPLHYLKVVIGNVTYYTDSLGNISLPGGGPDTATLSLEGKYCIIRDAANANKTPTFSFIFDSTANTASFDTSADMQLVSFYNHITTMHDFAKDCFAKANLPSLTAIDFPIPAYANTTVSTCGAFYNPGTSGNYFSFYKAYSSCNLLAGNNSVVYHEYGHFIDDKFYGGMTSTPLHEGYADVWSFLKTRDPKMGKGYWNDPAVIVRDYTTGVDPLVYPQDITGEPHNDGGIIAGAWWDLGYNLNSIDTMHNLFINALAAKLDFFVGGEGFLYHSILMEVLLIDDNDGDLTNGTPNAAAIVDAFARHGITIMMNASISHTEPNFLTADAPVSISATPYLAYYSSFKSLDLHYRTTQDTTWQTAVLSNGGSGYEAILSSMPKGTIIQYYFTLTDVLGYVALQAPKKATDSIPNLYYSTMVGFQKIAQDQLDDFGVYWTLGDPADNATSGAWQVGLPVTTYTSTTIKTFNTMVQTGTDHSNNGTNACAVTGNNNTATALLSDVDGGKTTLYTPVFDFTAYTHPVITYYRWFTNDMGGNPGADFWRVYISANQVDWVLVEETKVSDRSWRKVTVDVPAFITPGASVQLKFVAEDAAGSPSLVEAAIDDLFFYDLAGAAGVEEDITAIVFNIYPNPSTGEINISFTNAGSKNTDIKVFNVLGEIVYVENIASTLPESRHKLSLSGIGEGVYYIQLTQGDDVSRTKKVLIIR